MDFLGLSWRGYSKLVQLFYKLQLCLCGENANLVLITWRNVDAVAVCYNNTSSTILANESCCPLFTHCFPSFHLDQASLNDTIR